MSCETESQNPLQPELISSDQPLPLNAGNVQSAEEMADCQTWLSFHRLWGQLPVEAQAAIAQAFQPFRVEAQTLIYQEGHPATGLYILKWGAVDIYRLSPIGKSLIRQRSAGDLFGYVSLMAQGNHGQHQTQAIALTVPITSLAKRAI